MTLVASSSACSVALQQKVMARARHSERCNSSMTGRPSWHSGVSAVTVKRCWAQASVASANAKCASGGPMISVMVMVGT